MARKAKSSGRSQMVSAQIDLTQFNNMLQSVGPYSKSALMGVIQEISKTGADEMKKIIKESTSQFGFTRYQYHIGKGPGRYDSGDMYNSVQDRQTNASGKLVRFSFGWIDNRKDYFWYQDNGFNNVLEVVGFDVNSGKFIIRRRDNPVWQTGIFSLRDARKKAVSIIPSVVRKAERKLAKMIKNGKANT